MTIRICVLALLSLAACGRVTAEMHDAGASCTGAACADAGARPDATPDAPPPMSYPPAAVWLAPGGTSMTAGARLNASMGALYGDGTVTAPSGTTLTTGFLSTDTD